MPRRPGLSDAVEPLPSLLRRLRIERGLSFRVTARLAGISPDRVWRYEAGRLTPTPATLERLLAVLQPGSDR